MTQPFPSAAETLVTHEVVAHIVIEDDVRVPLPAELRYDTSDPYAVCLSIGTTSPCSVDWVFARSLLAEGTSRPTGAGDVSVMPRYCCHRPLVRVVVRSPAGAAVLDMAASAVTAFLERVHMVVPPGTEGTHIDFDRVLAGLLESGE
jgi:hypothetical protein